MLTTSVSVNSYELRSVDLKDLVLVVSSIPSDSYTLLSFFLEFPESVGKDLVMHSFRVMCSQVSVFNLSGCGTPHLFPFAI